MEGEAHTHSGRKLRNILIVIVAAAAIFFGVAYLLLFTGGQGRIPSGGITGGTWGGLGAGANESACGDECFLKLALESADSSFCSNVSAARSDECWQIFSHTELGACLNLRNYTLRKDCTEYLSFEQMNASLCDYLQEGDKQFCVERINPPCLDIADQAGRELCLAMRYNSSEYCSESACVLEYASTRNDSGACGALSNEAEKTACASVVGGTDLCFGLSGVYTRDYCYQLTAQYTDDYSYCNSIATALYKFNCYKSAAVYERNLSYCEKNDLEYLWECYRNYSLATGDMNGCFAINNRFASGSRDGCFYTFAGAFGDPSACNYLSNMYAKTNCYANTILDGAELTVEKCSAIWQENWKDKCFSRMALKAQQKEICGYIIDKGEKDRCEESIQ